MQHPSTGNNHNSAKPTEPGGKQETFADLILPLPLPGVFTYRVPETLRSGISPGMVAMVEFGRRRIYPAVIKELHDREPEGYLTKEILSLTGTRPVLLPLQLGFWEWMSEYYMCTPGEIMKSAIPVGLRPQGSGSSTTGPGTLDLFSLHPSVCSEEALNQLPEMLGRAPVQMALIMNYLHHTGYAGTGTPPEIPREMLITGQRPGTSSIRELVKKEILVKTTRTVSRLPAFSGRQKEMSMLNRFQEKALAGIREQFHEKSVVLLNGITSGGKTEIYIHLIKEQLDKGRQVLYLLPEIALTAQIITRLKSVFGEQAGVYHSKFSDAERVEIWNRVLNNDDNSYRLILGVRSSLFLPFRDMGLVIVDEEHENTFKQFDPAPRYHARDSAIMLASMHGASVLLGTATPSAESWFNSLSGKYGLAGLTKRYSEIELPEIVIADTREARKKKRMKGLFTPQLLDAVEEALSLGEQVILFQNRRGYAPFIECDDCGWVPVCKHCDVSLTYHKSLKQLVCHYCGASQKPPSGCRECSSTALHTRGFGTEKIEDEVSLFFPGARVGRLDLDSARGKRAHEKIINRFEEGKIDILAGTQMVAKGLDFGRVSLVGILNADNMLLFPDFRAHERSFQLMSQVAGRAGRKVKRGKVVIQTGFPGHPVIRNIIENNSERHFRELLAERRQFRYPPYVRLIKLVIKDKNRDVVERAASLLARRLREKFGSRVLGPEYPPVGRVQNRYIMNILLKIEKGADLSKARKLIGAEMESLHSQPGLRSCTLYADVDPV